MQKNWHTISLAEIFSETKSRKEGLISAEATQRLKEFGYNTLPQENRIQKYDCF